MSMDSIRTEKEIRAITDKIVREYQPEKIILFGSWAWGIPHEDSDVDLLVVKKSLTPRRGRTYELRRILPPPSFAFDVLVYTPEELQKSINENKNLFIEDIVRNGRVLYEKPGSVFVINLPARPLAVVS